MKVIVYELKSVGTEAHNKLASTCVQCRIVHRLTAGDCEERREGNVLK